MFDIGALVDTGSGTSSGAIRTTITDMTGARGFIGSFDPDTGNVDVGWFSTSSRGTGVNWREGVAPNSTSARAWLDDTVTWGNTCNLNGNATVSSLLFNCAGGTFTIAKDLAGHSLRLQSTIAANSQIQVLSGDGIVEPDITMTPGDPLIYVPPFSTLTLSGVLSEDGGAAGITIVGGATALGESQGKVILSKPTRLPAPATPDRFRSITRYSKRPTCRPR
jgi:hypothetical protein